MCCPSAGALTTLVLDGTMSNQDGVIDMQLLGQGAPIPVDDQPCDVQEQGRCNY